MSNRTSKRNAFTLAEMLVVITIIAILAAVIIGKYSQVRESGWSTRCKANLRSLYQAALNYTSDNGGGYPYAGSYELQNTLSGKWYEYRAWVNWIGSGTWPNTSPQAASMTMYSVGGNARACITNGTLWEYTSHDMAIYFCPKFRSLRPNIDFARTYAMNGLFGCKNILNAPASRAYWDPLTIQNFPYEPSRTLMFADMQMSPTYLGNGGVTVCQTYATGGTGDGDAGVLIPSVLKTDGSGNVDVPSSQTKPYESIGYLHRMAGEYRGHAVFLDGHVDAVGLRVHWKTPGGTVVFGEQGQTAEMAGWTRLSDGAWSNRTYDACEGQY